MRQSRLAKGNFKRNTRKESTNSYESVYVSREDLPQDLREVLASDDLRSEFMAFLRARLANESLLFYESIELYEKLETQTHRNRIGRKMVEEFVTSESIYWVNLGFSTREDLTSTVTFEEDTFDTAKSEVFTLMSCNFFESFKRHLAGVKEAETAPSLSYHLPEARSVSFSQLAEALGSEFKRTETDVTLPCDCDSPSDDHICCDKKKARMRIESMRGSLSSRPPLPSRKQRLTNVERGRLGSTGTDNSSRKLKTSKPRRTRLLSMFHKKTHTRAKSLAFWKDFEESKHL